MTIPLTILAAHFVGDFLLQSNWMALNKSKKFEALAIHCMIYSSCFVFWGPKFFFITLLTHFLTDYLTSRWTSKLWFIEVLPLRPEHATSYWTYTHVAKVGNSKRHWFFVVIGLDQLIHFATLALTLRYV